MLLDQDFKPHPIEPGASGGLQRDVNGGTPGPNGYHILSTRHVLGTTLTTHMCFFFQPLQQPMS